MSYKSLKLIDNTKNSIAFWAVVGMAFCACKAAHHQQEGTLQEVQAVPSAGIQSPPAETPTASEDPVNFVAQRRFPPCESQSGENTTFAQAIRVVILQLSQGVNELTALGLDASKLCIVVTGDEIFPAVGDPATGRILVSEQFGYDQKDLDVAFWAPRLAIELGHIALEHGVREPSLTELSQEADAQELNRRFRTTAVFKERRSQLEDLIVTDAQHDGVVELFAKVVKNMPKFMREIRKSGGSKFHKEFLAVEKNLNLDSLKDSLDVLLSGDVLSKTQALATIGKALKIISRTSFIADRIRTPLLCSEIHPCEDIFEIGRASQYYELRIEPAVVRLTSTSIGELDDPLSYQPYLIYTSKAARDFANILLSKLEQPKMKVDPSMIYEKQGLGIEQSECTSRLLKLLKLKHERYFHSFSRPSPCHGE